MPGLVWSQLPHPEGLEREETMGAAGLTHSLAGPEAPGGTGTPAGPDQPPLLPNCSGAWQKPERPAQAADSPARGLAAGLGQPGRAHPRQCTWVGPEPGDGSAGLTQPKA